MMSRRGQRLLRRSQEGEATDVGVPVQLQAQGSLRASSSS
jgi:hypothetical protein